MMQIALTQGKVAVVDDADFDGLAAFNWCATRHRHRWYAVRRTPKGADGKSVIVRMHRQILGAPVGLDVDHRDGDGLNCQRENLRVATRQQNSRNQVHHRAGTSPLKGASRSGTRRWRATIRVGQGTKGRLHLGYFDTDVEAARAYDRAARQHFGAFASLNFPQETP